MSQVLVGAAIALAIAGESLAVIAMALILAGAIELAAFIIAGTGAPDASDR